MNQPAPRLRSGITLTEILISILIMGIGMISLATLFPLGLIRIRAAARATRSSQLAESAGGDLSARNLLIETSFTSGQTAWYRWGVLSFPYDSPFTHDPTTPNDPSVPGGVARTIGQGLPICYDPLWRATVGLRPNMPGGATPVDEARFASGIGYILSPGTGTTGTPSAHGLQRLTNLPVPTPVMTQPPTGSQWGSVFVSLAGAAPQPSLTLNWNNMAASIFPSPDDLVYQTEGNTDVSIGRGSPLVPELTITNGYVPVADWSYSWLFTGQQSDVGNGTMYDGDIVVLNNRPFSLDQVTTPAGTSAYKPAGETVVEGIFAYGSSVTGGYSPNDRVVLLRWPASMPDPEIHVGGWIADVTYERYQANDTARFNTALAAGQSQLYPGQRCYWYRVVKRSPAEDEVSGTTPAPTTPANYRRMTVTVATPVRARTLLSPGGAPIIVNAALVSPYVVNVIPKQITSR